MAPSAGEMTEGLQTLAAQEASPALLPLGSNSHGGSEQHLLKPMAISHGQYNACEEKGK